MFRYLFFGLVFGFILSRVGATDYDTIISMFLLKDLHLAGVMVTAILVGAGGLAYLRHEQKKGGMAEMLNITPKQRKPGNIVGGLIFGAGWGLTGACPGTVLAQIGEGKLLALFTLAGMLCGTALYLKVGARMEKVLIPGSWTHEVSQGEGSVAGKRAGRRQAA